MNVVQAFEELEYIAAMLRKAKVRQYVRYGEQLQLVYDAFEKRLIRALDALEARKLPDDKAKAEIKGFFEKHDGEVIYPSDVAADLRLAYDTVARLIAELERDGEIAISGVRP